MLCRNVHYAGTYSQNTWLAIRNSSCPTGGDILPRLEELTTQPSRSIQKVEQINLVLDGEVSRSIERARNTGECSQLQPIGSSLTRV